MAEGHFLWHQKDEREQRLQNVHLLTFLVDNASGCKFNRSSLNIKVCPLRGQTFLSFTFLVAVACAIFSATILSCAPSPIENDE